MPTPTVITDLSTTAASNFPAGSDSPASLDDVQRAHGAFIAQLRDDPTANLTVAIPVAKGGTGSTTAAAARTALGAAASGALASSGITGAAASGANADITSLTALTSPVSEVRQLQPITAAIASNAITVTPSALSLEFRNTTLTNGAVSFVEGTPSALVIAATDSFGLVTAAGNQRIAILAINNAGTIELAASALAGGVSLDETGVITTATAATLGTHIKAANVRTGVAYRVIGFVDATFTTATGWGSLALVQGTGGQALAAMSSLGYGQTWQSPGRIGGVTYYNTTGKPIFISVTSNSTGSGAGVNITVNGVVAAQVSGSALNRAIASAIVPIGGSYKADMLLGSALDAFTELR